MVEVTIRMKETDVIKKQNAMFPAVSMRALPDGNLLGSTRLTARFDRIKVTLLNGSKMASAMVVRSDSEPEDAAP